MRRRAFLRTLLLGVFCASLATTFPAAGVIAEPGHQKKDKGGGNKKQGHRQGQQQERQRGEKQRNGDKQRDNGRRASAQQAAGEAQRRYGGRVLKVDPRGSGYQVRLLQDDGRVITVFIGD